MKILVKMVPCFCLIIFGFIFVSFSAGSTSTLRLQSGWKNYGGDYQSAMVKKDNFMCAVEGMVVAQGKKECLIAKLPDGYRPAYRLAFVLCSNNQNVRVDVTPKGEIIFIDGALSNGLLSLNGIIFSLGDAGLADLKFRKVVCLLGEPSSTIKNYIKEKKYQQQIFETTPYPGPEKLFGKPTFFKGSKLCILHGMVQESFITIDYPIKMYFDLLAHEKISLLKDIYPKKLDHESPKNVPVKFFLLNDDGTLDERFGGLTGLPHVPYLGYLSEAGTFPVQQHVFCTSARAAMNRVDVGTDGYLYWISGPRKNDFGMPLEYLSLSGIVYAVDEGTPLKLIHDISENYGHGYCFATCGTDGDFCWVQGLIKLQNKRLVAASANNQWLGTVIAKLPDRFPRPSKRLVFRANAHDAVNRVDILPNGEIRWISGQRQVDWLSLSGIVY